LVRSAAFELRKKRCVPQRLSCAPRPLRQLAARQDELDAGPARTGTHRLEAIRDERMQVDTARLERRMLAARLRDEERVATSRRGVVRQSHGRPPLLPSRCPARPF
jgi:hypothetical protein